MKEILQKRLEEFNKDAKKAFSNLDENPIWLNKEKDISIKRVTISGVNNVEAIHYKKDHNGNLQEDVVSFFEAVENNVALLINDSSHLPIGLMLPLATHSTYTEKLKCQIDASQPLKKNLWQQTIKKKILNQAALLNQLEIDNGRKTTTVGSSGY